LIDHSSAANVAGEFVPPTTADAARTAAPLEIVASHSAVTAQHRRGYANVPRTLIVDDSEQFLASAERLLSVGGVSVVGTARSGSEAVRLAEELRPDVALVDIDLGGESGLDVARDLAALVPAPVVVLISTHTETDVSEMVATSPAAGFIPKSRLDAAAVRALLR
jgi:two-component system, NarL family, nitrate/nitrite response regulator NarL